MSHPWHVLTGVAVAPLLAWLALLVAEWSGAPRPAPDLSDLPARLHSRCAAGASLRRHSDCVLRVMRSVLRVAGEEPIRRDRPGTSTRCEALLRLTRTNQRAGSQRDVSGGLA